MAIIREKRLIKILKISIGLKKKIINNKFLIKKEISLIKN